VGSRLGDLGEDSRKKLEYVEGLALRMGGQGVVVGAFALVEQCLGAGHPMNARQTYRAPQQVSAESFEPLGILRPYGGRCVNGEAATAKRTEQLNAFVTQESLALQQVQYFVSEQLLGSDGIDVGDRQPLTLLIPKPTRGKSMQVLAASSIRSSRGTGPERLSVY